MAKPRVCVMTGYGINCEEETAFAFEKAGASAEVVHVNDLIAGTKKLGDYRILAFPGGFSYGDDTGSGNAYANRLKNNIWEKVHNFVEDDNLVIGICNGFQILVNLGLLPHFKGSYERKVALLHNDTARYTTRWVDVEFEDTNGPWTKNLGEISLPIAHGEGRFYADPAVLSRLKEKKMVAGRYVKGEVCKWQDLRANPNGALDDIAGITDETGRVLGLMPHPERAIAFSHLPHWTYLREKLSRDGKEIPKEGPGLKVFQNAVEYF